MIFNLKDLELNNYVSWVYNELEDIAQSAYDEAWRIYDYIGYFGQLVPTLALSVNTIPSGQDLNNYMQSGNYVATGSGIANSIGNSPTTLNFKLTVEVITNSFVMQTVKARDGGVWRRIYNFIDSTWTDWESGYTNNIKSITMNNNGELLVTRVDGVTATFNPDSLL